MRHNLYVKVANDSLSYQLTLEILQYVQKNINILKKMEVELHVVKLTFDELENTAVQQSLLQRGITKLPALTTSQNIYLGNTEIINIYEKNIKDYLAATSAPQSNNIIQEDDDFLDSFMKKEINAKENDYAGDDDMNDSSGSSLMQDYQRKMDQRKNMMPAMPNQPQQQQPQQQPRQPQPRQPQPRQPQQQPPPQSSQANDIEETLKKLQNDIDNNLQMDDADVEYEKNPNDDIMERALWNRIDLND